MIRRPPRSTLDRSSAASDVYKRQGPSNRRMLVRLVILGGCLFLASTPGWITLVVDRDGFGGFPHRVNDEVGPGYKELTSWFTRGGLLDYARPMVLTWLVPVVW